MLETGISLENGLLERGSWNWLHGPEDVVRVLSRVGAENMVCAWIPSSHDYEPRSSAGHPAGWCVYC